MMMANNTGNTTKADRLEALGYTATGKTRKIKPITSEMLGAYNAIEVHATEAGTHSGGSR